MNVFGPNLSPLSDLIGFAVTLCAIVWMVGSPILIVLGIRALWRAGSGTHRHRVEESLYYLSRAAWAIDTHLRGENAETLPAHVAHADRPHIARRVANSMFAR